jgi:Spy/CpxP family protein refolding chaperone
MKRNIILLSVAVFILVLTGFALAQMEKRGPQDGPRHQMLREHEPGMFARLELTDAQKEQIEKLRTEHEKKVLPLRNEVGELRAELRTLSTVDKVNMSDINKKIDEIGKVQTELMKERAAHRQQIRSLLTDEQRVKFDSHFGRGSMGRGRMQKHRHWDDD